MRSPLRNQIFFPIAGLLALAMLLFTGISAWHATAVRREQTAEHMQAVTRALGTASYPLTDDVVRRIGALISGRLIVADDQQNVTASNVTDRDDFHHLLAQLPSASPTEASAAVVRTETETLLVTAIRRPHVHPVTTLYVIMRQDEFATAWRRSLNIPAVVAITTLALALFSAKVIAGRLAGQVADLRTLFGRLAEGDFRPVAISDRDDEIRDLVQSANVLAEQLRSMREELQTAERLQLLSQLSGGLAHQLKNSIAGTRLALQLHQRRCESDDPMIHTALAQLALTEEQVLAVVTLQSEDSECSDRSVCDIGELMTDIVTLLRPHASHWKSRITLSKADHLRVLLNSPQSLKGGLLNIVQNAIEAAGVGGDVACRIDAEIKDVVVTISDSGDGFRADARILTAAFQTTKSQGIGLGLTIAQHAIDQEDGTLTIERVGDRTVVTVRIPHQQSDIGKDTGWTRQSDGAATGVTA